MWGVATAISTGALLVSLVTTEVLRSLMHRQREKLSGLGGTQDIAMWGAFASMLCIMAVIAFGVLWLRSR